MSTSMPAAFASAATASTSAVPTPAPRASGVTTARSSSARTRRVEYGLRVHCDCVTCVLRPSASPRATASTMSFATAERMGRSDLRTNVTGPWLRSPFSCTKRSYGRGHTEGGRNVCQIRNSLDRSPVVRGMKVEVYSDIACPWCYIGKHRFERALAAFPGAESVEVVFRPYQLDPAAPAVATSHREYLNQRYGPDSAQMDARVAKLGLA